MVSNPNTVKLNDLKKLTSSDPAENTTLRAALEFKKQIAEFGYNVLGIFLQTEDGSSTQPIGEFKDVLTADRPVNIWVDIQYPGEPSFADADGVHSTGEKSNLGQLINQWRQAMESGGPVACLSRLRDVDAFPAQALADMYNSSEELRKLVNDYVKAKLVKVFVAEEQAVAPVD